MRLRHAAAVVVIATAAACSSGTPAPSAPTTTPVPTPTPTPAPSNVAGRWSGTGSDPQGGERMTWTLTQSDASIAGTATLAPLDAADGSCASCHKFKNGTISGTSAAGTLTLRLVFPAGGDGVPTPMCTITFDATATATAGNRIDATYTGQDTCEGPISGGAFTMTR